MQAAAAACRLLLVLGLGLATACDSSSPAPAPPPVASPPPPAPQPPPDPPPPVYWPDGNTSTGGYGNRIMGLSCGEMLETYHVHTHLSFFLNGDQLALPRSVGSVAPRPGTSCYYPLHTHDMSGKVHVEASAPAVFTLGQFFAIWGQPLEPTNIAGFTDLPVVIYIVDVMADGKRTASRYEGDFHAIELKSQRGIVVQLGTKIAEIPTYTWYGP
jgi:hypothetical protein